MTELPEMYFVTREEEEDEMPMFGGRRDKKDEHDNMAGQPKEVQRDKAKQTRADRSANKTGTLRGRKATKWEGKGER